MDMLSKNPNNPSLPYSAPGDVSSRASPERKKSRKTFFIFGGIGLVIIAVLAGRVTLTFQNISENSNVALQKFDDEHNFFPQKDPDRVNVLVLGIRGKEDPEGGLLTDGIVVLSVQKSTGHAALISIPRDLWVRMPGRREYDKINAVYALGFEERGQGTALAYAKSVVERVSGLTLDGAVSVNLEGVKEFIDTLGGVTVKLQSPFIEDRQWIRGGDMGTSTAFSIRTDTVSTSQGVVESQKWVFALPAGTQTLDGITTLYYLRARFSSNDFDRARREQQVLVAIREKVTSLGFLLNPFKLNDLLRAFERNVSTDLEFSRISEFASYASRIKSPTIRHVIFSSGENELLEVKYQNNLYTLIPKSGNFDAMREVSRNVFKE
ncbi:MAG: LCP family protein [bacterium]|nr:LCP family protein [bacterium]